MKFLLRILLTSLLAIYIAVTPMNIYAQRGCCSWHDGISHCGSNGKYVCNDGTYSPSCTCGYSAPVSPTYRTPIAPSCIRPEIKSSTANWIFTKNGCNQDVTISWTAGGRETQYSVGFSKLAGADPGPKADTSARNWTFKNIKPGKWYFNVKPGNSCGWGSVYYWDVDVPQVEPQASLREEIIDEETRKLHYSVECASLAEITPSVGKVSLTNSFVTVKPKGNTVYYLTATQGNKKTSKSVSIKYPLPTPTPSPTNDPNKYSDSQSKSRNIPSWIKRLPLIKYLVD